MESIQMEICVSRVWSVTGDVPHGVLVSMFAIDFHNSAFAGFNEFVRRSLDVQLCIQWEFPLVH